MEELLAAQDGAGGDKGGDGTGVSGVQLVVPVDGKTAPSRALELAIADSHTFAALRESGAMVWFFSFLKC